MRGFPSESGFPKIGQEKPWLVMKETSSSKEISAHEKRLTLAAKIGARTG
jgi:hypothetical protein